MSTISRLARLTAILVACLGILLLLGAALSSEVQPDADAYWLAAQRLREGQPLYGGPRGDETEIYRYSPWFAIAWVPLTYLGQESAYLVWRGLLLAATIAAVWPLLRRPSPAAITLAILLGGLLLTNLPAANVTPLLVGALTLGIRTRAGPAIIGFAASLKVFPLLFIAGYVAERRWTAAAASVLVTALLWLSVLAFDIGRYASVGGASFYVGGVSLFGVSSVVWLPVAVGAAAIVAWLAREGSPWTWGAAGAAIPLVVPRVWLPDAAYVLPGIAPATDGSTSKE